MVTMFSSNTASKQSDVIALEHVYFRYAPTPSTHMSQEVTETQVLSDEPWLLEDITLHIQRGERVVLCGSNGSGKSTLAQMLAGLIAPDKGDIMLNRMPVFHHGKANAQAYAQAREHIGVLFQSPEDQILTTVCEDDIAFGLENLQVPQTAMGARIAHALTAVNMQDRRFDNPTTMSGGEQQRVALAGALAMQSQIFVLDEPTSMLDSQSRKDVAVLLDDLHAQGHTIVQVTHQLEECAHADRILLLEHGSIREISFDALQSLRKKRRQQLYERLATSSSIAHKTVVSSAKKPDDTPLAVDVRHVTFRYQKHEQPVLHDMSLQIPQGQTVAIMGSNGSGKSTLAQAICSLLPIHEGSMKVDGISLTAKSTRAQRKWIRQRIGYVMQRPEQQLFEETVFEDVAYGPKNFGLDGDTLIARVHTALQTLHIEHLAKLSPFKLSGGQQRLVAIAGVLACNPRVLVLDEPTAGLDDEAALLLQHALKQLQAQGVTIVIITHNIQEAQALNARIIMLEQSAHADPSTAPAETTAKPTTAAPLQSCDPRTRLLGCMILMFSAFSVLHYSQLAILTCATFALAWLARVSIKSLLASTHMLVAILIFSGILNIFFVQTGHVLAQLGPLLITDDGIHFAILFAARFSLVVFIGSILLRTCTTTTLTEACMSLIKPLRIFGLPTQELSMIMSLALRFLPTLSYEAHAVMLAQMARGSSIRDASMHMRLRAMLATVVPGFLGVIRHADTLSLTLDARCYTPGKPRTHWHVSHMRLRDLFALVAVIAIVAAIICCGFMNVGESIIGIS